MSIAIFELLVYNSTIINISLQIGKKCLLEQERKFVIQPTVFNCQVFQFIKIIYGLRMREISCYVID